MSYVLVVDDEPTICWGFRELLGEMGHEVAIASSAEDGFRLIRDRVPDAVVLDVRLPGMDGLSAMEKIRSLARREIPIIVITAFGNLDTAVRAISEGAFDYLAKPFDLEDARALILRALEEGVPAKRESESVPERSGQLLGTSAPMQAIFKQIALVAVSDVPVLITGESGTGKEEVASAIHRHSNRRNGPFVPICLGALNSQIIESELFGHARGAFTGAEGARVGLLEMADQGSAFLDEIGDVPLAIQVKLLRTIERKEFTPVGESRTKRSDFRVIAATNRPLDRLVQNREFREDLLYRLSVFPIHLPPLRERREDIPILARHFLECAGHAGSEFTPETMAELIRRPWTGNVRELRNAVERAAVLARGGPIHPEHLIPRNQTVVDEVPSDRNIRIQQDLDQWTREKLQSVITEEGELYEEYLRFVEAPLLRATLESCQNNRAQAARKLGIHRTTLRQKLKELLSQEGEEEEGGA